MDRKVPSARARFNARRNPRDRETDLDRSATLHLVIALGRALKEIGKWVRPQLACQGLGVTEFAVLEVLYHKGPLPLGEIRDQILVTGPSTTYIVKKLEQRGLMRRRPSGEDQRVVFGELTPAGRKLIGRVFPAHVERLRRAMAGLSVQEKRTAGHLMRKLARHARDGGRAGLPKD
jgi:MarR family transcriptional regulator, 2-MHQ and catechol-resistance regulon repressor